MAQRDRRPPIPWVVSGSPEIHDGPRGRWLRAAEERFGPKVWAIIQTWPARRADKFIEARFMPFEDSMYAMEEESALKKGRTTCRFERKDAVAREKEITVEDPFHPKRRHGGPKDP